MFVIGFWGIPKSNFLLHATKDQFVYLSYIDCSWNQIVDNGYLIVLIMLA